MSEKTSEWDLRESPSTGAAGRVLADGLRSARAGITLRWLERITEHATLGEDQMFPTEDLLDHVPLLIDAIADYVADPGGESTAADQVIAKATELGQMRHEQGFSSYHILKEFEILGGILLTRLGKDASKLSVEAAPEELIAVTLRIQQALSKVQQATAARHLALTEQLLSDREHRLRLIQRILTDDTPRERRARRVARMEGEPRRQRNVGLGSVIHEAVRRVAPIAKARAISVRVGEEVPGAEVTAGLVEHCLVGFLTNAIRHSAEAGRERWVDVLARIDDERDQVLLEVRDTGVPIDPELAEALLREPDDDAGSPTVTENSRGLGLAFMAETARALSGRVWAEPADDPPGTRFVLALPCRRTGDREPASGPDA